jgi:hypothetical protein
MTSIGRLLLSNRENTIFLVIDKIIRLIGHLQIEGQLNRVD